MEKRTNPAWEHFKLILWVILIIEFLLFLIALTVGRASDFQLIFYTSFWIGLLIAIVFLCIYLLNILEILLTAGVKKVRKMIAKGRGSRDVN